MACLSVRLAVSPTRVVEMPEEGYFLSQLLSIQITTATQGEKVSGPSNRFEVASFTTATLAE